ncbi:MAG TPA: hypothetical protein VMX97_03520 [Hyphomicrobiaceae bacterium]|nr:hypothetical protein [Hyphomicrobiaceae bacterium]
MTTAQEVKSLKEELQALKAMLGIRSETTVPDADRADYFEHGSERHAVFLGLVPAKPDDEDHITFTSPRTGNTYRLEDEITQFMNYHDPEKAAQLTLQQKVNELEIAPGVPDTARPMWRPLRV